MTRQIRCGSGKVSGTDTGMRQVQQSGQALVEALICLMVIAVLWVAVAWLGRIQDLALHAQHGARFSAFAATRGMSHTAAAAMRAAVFHGPASQWADRRANRLPLSVYQDIALDYHRAPAIPDADQVGGSHANASQLRHDWITADDGVLSARIRLIPGTPGAPGVQGSGMPEAPDTETETESAHRSLLGLQQFDDAYPVIRRHVSIMTGSGHAGSDRGAAHQLANSRLAWSGPAENAYRAGRRVSDVATRVDHAWGRPAPVFDWLGLWAANVPEHHVRSGPLPGESND